MIGAHRWTKKASYVLGYELMTCVLLDKLSAGSISDCLFARTIDKSVECSFGFELERLEIDSSKLILCS